MLTREEAWNLLREYNKEPFHLRHALTVEGIMPRNWAMVTRLNIGAWWAFCTIWTLSFILRSIA